MLIDPDVPASQGWFSFDDVPLKWHYPIGLLFDILAGISPAKRAVDLSRHQPVLSREESTDATVQSPWELTVHFSDWPSDRLIPLDPSGKTNQDVFFQNVKEADYLRNGKAKAILSLSKEDSSSLWQSVQDQDLAKYLPIYRKFLNPQDGEILRNIPMKLYIPRTPVSSANQSSSQHQSETRGALRVVQGLIPPTTSSSRGPQTLGTALHDLLPKLFPSRTSFIHAQAVLHGAVVPLTTKLEELVEGAAFCDGFLHIAVRVMDLDLIS